MSPSVDAEAKVPSSELGLEGKRVAMVVFSSYPADPRPRRAADALVSEGMSVDLICLADDAAPSREVSRGVHVRRLPIKHTRGGKFSYAYNYLAFIAASGSILAARALRKRYDLVYVHNMPDVLVLSGLAPKLLGANVLLDLHDPMPELMTTIFGLPAESSAVRMMKLLEKWSLGFADRVLTVNIACERMFSARSCPAEKIGVVMNAPDDRIFQFRPAAVSGRRTRSSNDPFVMMYHGSLVERNGLDLAVEALAKARERCPRIELRVYGRQTPFLENVMRDVGERNLRDSVRYLGPKSLEQLVSEIESCDVGVIPNHRSAFSEINTPTRIFEYLALGKPVIAPGSQGIRDYFDDRSLVFFELGDSADLARQIEYVFFHPAEVEEVVTRGQQVYQEHSWPKERWRLVKTVSDLLRERPVPADATRSVRPTAHS